MVWISSPGRPKHREWLRCSGEARPKSWETRNKIIHCIPSWGGQLALCTLSNQFSKRSIEMKERQLQYSLYRWITWGSERLSSFPRSGKAISTQPQLPVQWRQKAADKDCGRLCLRGGAVPDWLQKNKDRARILHRSWPICPDSPDDWQFSIQLETGNSSARERTGMRSQICYL